MTSTTFLRHLSAGTLPSPTDLEGWAEFWQNYEAAQLTKVIGVYFRSDDRAKQGIEFLRALLQGSRLVTHAEAYDAVVTTVYAELLGARSGAGRPDEAYHRDVADLLSTEVRYFTPRTTLSLAFGLVTQIQGFVALNPAALEVAPNLLQALSALEDIGDSEVAADFGGLTCGADVRDALIGQICTHPWHPTLNLGLVSVFRDLPLSNTQLDVFINKVFKVLRTVEAEEIPPLVYQLLLFAKKGKGRTILSRLLAFFEELEAMTDEAATGIRQNSGAVRPHLTIGKLRRAESVVLVHLSFAVKQDQALGQVLLKLAKVTCPARLSPFFLSTLLAVSKIHRFEFVVIDLLRAKIATHYRNQVRQRQILTPSLLASSPSSPAPAGEAGGNLEATFARLASDTSLGWDQTIPGLIQLSLVLIDAAGGSGAAPAFFTVKTKERPVRDTLAHAIAIANYHVESVDPADPALPSETEALATLGTTTLHNVFRAHRMVRPDILDQVMSRIEFRAESTALCARLLGDLVAELPETLVSDYLPRFKELTNCLAALAPDVAERIMTVILPLARHDRGFCDHLMLVLRKHMFSRDLEGRQVALMGLLVFLASLTGSGSNGNSGYSNGGGRDQLPLVLEILGMLQRCLTQQLSLRLRLYQGLTALLGLTELAPPVLHRVFQMLRTQLDKYLVTPPNSIPPLRVELAAGNGDVPGEPLPWLLQAILCTYRHILRDHGPSTVPLDEFTTTLATINGALLQSELNDFGLDAGADFNPATQAGTRKGTVLAHLVGVYEALLEHEMAVGGVDPVARSLLALDERYAAVRQLAVEKLVNAKARKGVRPAAVPHVADLNTVVQLLGALFPADGLRAEDSSGASELVHHLPFVYRVLHMAHAQLQAMIGPVVSSSSTAVSGITRDLPALNALAALLTRAYLIPWIGTHGRLTADVGFGGRDRTLGYVHLVVDMFALSLRGIARAGSEALRDLAAMLARESQTMMPPTGPRPEGLAAMLQLVQQVAVAFVTENVPLYRDLLPLLTSLEILVSTTGPLATTTTAAPLSDAEVESAESARRHLAVWLDKFCTEVPVEDLPIVRALLRLSGALHPPLPPSIDSGPRLNSLSPDSSGRHFVVALADDLRTLLGDLLVREDVEPVDGIPRYAIITHRTSTAVAQFIIEQVTRYLQDADWALTQLRDQLATLKVPDLQRLEAVALARLRLAIHALVVLEQTYLPSSIPVPLLKALQHTYKLLGDLVRLKLSEKVGVSRDLTNLIQLVGSELSKYLYDFIPQFQAKDTQDAVDSVQRKKRKPISGGDGGNALSSSTAPKALLPAKFKIKMVKESRLIPQLVYSLEQFERYVIKLSSQARVNLTQYLRRSTAHDFLIVQQQLESLDDEDEADDEIARIKADQVAEMTARANLADIEALHGAGTEDEDLSHLLLLDEEDYDDPVGSGQMATDGLKRKAS
ncbi:hypothetical protein IWQ60_007892 [Tieghemiomyces parasiticus]|uniref:Uncharacterized protein n=1 Tax=Tieghemiomyces parasiticus TaxID=78921 RepID=A0A9W8A499_9FUNG|nr:hypothetical protein IWQ60_007892 [Tieghemiomyces parasiticus]